MLSYGPWTLRHSTWAGCGKPEQGSSHHAHGQHTGAPQLPVLALKPDRLSFSMTTADLHIWKNAYKAYHNASHFDSYPLAEQQAFLFRCSEVAIKLRREATKTTPIFLDNYRESCESIISSAFNERHPLHQRRWQFFNFQQSTSQDTLEAGERLLILMKEADVDRMGQEVIACMMMFNCFLDMSLKAKLGGQGPHLSCF